MADDYRIFEKQLAASYQAAAEQYRCDDEFEVGTANHRRICGNLARITSSFGRSIYVLDVGCGTGRYFHCLTNVELLVGVDISAEMLRVAEKPARSEEISAKTIRLLQCNIYEHTFPSEMFDLIYCFGVFGHGAQLTSELCRKFHRWLGHDGRLYFDAIESADDPPLIAARRRIKRVVQPWLPRRLRQRLDERAARLPVLTMTHEELDSALRAGGFTDFSISTNDCRSALWSGSHLECLAVKGRRKAPASPARGCEVVMPPGNFP